MKYIISESKLESVITDFLIGRYIPDYGWASKQYYEKEVKKYGYTHFEINDIYGYFYLYAANELNNNLPKTLFIHDWVEDTLNGFFGDAWKPVFVKWFENNTGLPVEHLMFSKDRL